MLEFLQRTGKNGGGEGDSDRAMVSDVEGVRSLGGRGALSSKGDVIVMSSGSAWRSLVSKVL